MVFFFIDKRENVYVVKCDGETFCNDPKWIGKIKNKYHRKYRCQLYFPDIANGSALDLMKQASLPVANEIDKSVNLGLQVIKRLLRTPGTGDPKNRLATGCTKLGNQRRVLFLLGRVAAATSSRCRDRSECAGDS